MAGGDAGPTVCRDCFVASLPRNDNEYFTPTLLLPPQGGGKKISSYYKFFRGRRLKGLIPLLKMKRKRRRWIPIFMGIT